MNHSKKLKRGLEELSPLFQEPARALKRLQVLDNREAEPERRDLSPIGSILAICRGDGSNFSSAALMAGMLFPQEKDALLLTITDGVSVPKTRHSYGGLYRCPLSWTDFRKLCSRNEVRVEAPLNLSRNVVLDFDLRTGFPEEALLPLVDKCIFWIQPEFEHLASVYKLIKSVALLNHSLECYFVYEGEARDPKGEFVFEKLAELCLKQLGLDLTWLGSAWVDDENSGMVCDLRLEHLWLKPVDKTLIPEKAQLLRFAAAVPAGEGN